MSFGSFFLGTGGGGGVRRMAPCTAPSSSAEATGPSDANHTSSIDSSRARIARATSADTRGAFSVAARDIESSALFLLTGRSALTGSRSEEHTSELQSLTTLVCRLLLEKKKKTNTSTNVNQSAICRIVA